MAPLGAGYFIYSEIRQRRRAARMASETESGIAVGSPDATADPSAAARSRRERVRADLREAGTASGARQRHQIGNAPESETADADVRAKLSRRYGD